MTPQQLLTYANELAIQFPWPMIISSGILTPLLGSIKHWLQIEGDKTYKLWFLKFKGEQLIVVLLIALAALSSFIAQKLTMPTTTPWLVAVQTGLTYFTMQPVYFMLFKPALSMYNGWLERQVQQRIAALGLPVTPTELTGEAAEAVATTGTTQQFN